MDKKFEEFENLVSKTSEADAIVLFDDALASCGIEPQNHSASVPLDKLPYVLASFSSSYTFEMLRKYHEWLNADD